MKKSILALAWLLFVLTTLFPSGALIAACFGYDFELASVCAHAVVIAVVSVCTVIVTRKATVTKVPRIIFALITPLSLVNAVFIIIKCNRFSAVISVLISAGCCCFLTVKHGKPLALKIAALALSALMILPPVGYVGFFALAFSGIGQNTVVQTAESPSGRYYAQIIDSDQGAFGGNTFVDVYEKRGINLFLFSLKKKPQRVYSGDWLEYKNMQIYWKDDCCLVINSTEYEINSKTP